ncbi:MAG: DUF2063 domain-containing protein [Thiohalomonadales bacterium]
MSVDLKTLQSQFSHFVLEGDQAIKDQIISTTVLKSDLRLAIYANAYVSRMVEVLETDYPVLSHLLGEDDFFSLATAYTRRHPSTQTSLRWFGRHMVEFIRAQAEFEQVGFVAEIALLEWRLACAFNTKDVDSITEADVAAVPPEKWPELSLVFHPSVSWFNYEWNTIALWNAVKDEKPIPTAVKLSADESAASGFPASEKCLVWRYDLRTLFRTLQPDERAVIQPMLEGATFGELCERLTEYSETPQEVPMQAAGLLKTWISNGLITGLNY